MSESGAIYYYWSSDSTEPKRQRGGICVHYGVSTPKATSFVQTMPAPKMTSIDDTEGVY
jgi:hypothetical protein